MGKDNMSKNDYPSDTSEEAISKLIEKFVDKLIRVASRSIARKLMDVIYDGMWAARNDTVGALVEIAKDYPKMVTHHLQEKALCHESVAVRRYALETLGEMAIELRKMGKAVPKEVVGELLKLSIEDKNWWNKRVAIVALKPVLRDSWEKPKVLFAALENKNSAIRYNAANGLMSFYEASLKVTNNVFRLIGENGEDARQYKEETFIKVANNRQNVIANSYSAPKAYVWEEQMINLQRPLHNSTYLANSALFIILSQEISLGNMFFKFFVRFFSFFDCFRWSF